MSYYSEKFTMKGYAARMDDVEFKRHMKMTVEEFNMLCSILDDTIDTIIHNEGKGEEEEEEEEEVVMAPEQQQKEKVKSYPDYDYYDSMYGDESDTENDDEKEEYKNVGHAEMIGLTLRYYTGGSYLDKKAIFQIRSTSAFFRIIEIVSEAISLSKTELQWYIPDAYKKLRKNMDTFDESEREEYLRSLWKKTKNQVRYVQS